MTGADELQQLREALWPQGAATRGSLWAILDCARSRTIYQLMVMSRLDYQCLYSGRLPTQLKLVAPYMVELSPHYAFTTTLLERGLGRSWGIFVRIDDWTQLRHHLRKLLTVRDSAGRRLLFRFYDPRVLRAFLPTCTTDELRQVFGPVDSFLVETVGVKPSLDAHSFDGIRLRTHSTALEEVPC